MLKIHYTCPLFFRNYAQTYFKLIHFHQPMRSSFHTNNTSPSFRPQAIFKSSFKLNWVFYVIGLGLLTSCNYLAPQKPSQHLARVNDIYLDKAELTKALPQHLSATDSAIFAQSYITHWATKQLLLAGAKRNLPQQVQNEYDAMVKAYREELYTQAYKDMIIAHQMDTSVTEQQIEAYYSKNKENFKLNESLVKLRYIKLKKDYSQLSKIKEQFKRYDSTDQAQLHDESIKFLTASFNDSVWIRTQTLYKQIPPFKPEDSKENLQKNKYIELKDSLNVYLIYIKDVRLRHEQAPLFYVRPTLKEIILNKRKLDFAKDFEKNITKDALEDNQFEIYR